MASLRKQISTRARAEDVWEAVRDVGALHTRLVPGFVAATRLEGNERVVTFGNGMTVREPIVTVDDAARRLVWTAAGGRTTHYNAALQVCSEGGDTTVIWTVDLLPDAMAAAVEAMMAQGLAAMQSALDRLAP